MNDSSSNWPDPIPLDREHEKAEPYPIEALPPLMRDACIEYQNYGQQPMALVAGSALANLSLACQGLADVSRDSRLRGPISLFILIVAESGERKSAADKEFGRALRDWQQDKENSLKEEKRRAHAERLFWESECDGVRNKIKAAAGGEKRSRLIQLKEELQRLELDPPQKVMVPTIFYEMATTESLIEGLHDGWPSTSLWSDEAGLVVGGHSMKPENILKALSCFNRLWDGQPLRSDTKTSGKQSVGNRRLTCSLMLQDVVLKQLVMGTGGLSRGTGFLARMLIANPNSTMGTRLYREPRGPFLRVDAFQNRLTRLIDLPLTMDGCGNISPPLLRLSPAAKAAWTRYYNGVERELKSLGNWAEVKDFASKSAENAARIAANFHVLEKGPAGDIEAGTMLSAIEISRWYLGQARRVFCILQVPEEIEDAKILLDWLRARGGYMIPKGDILRLGPSKLRDRQRRDRALKILLDHHQLIVRESGKSAGVMLNPSYEDSETRENSEFCEFDSQLSQLSQG